MGNLISTSEAQTFLRLGTSVPSETQSLIDLLIGGAESWISGFCGVALTSGSQTELFPEYEEFDSLFYRPRLLPITAITKISDLRLGTDLAAAEYQIVNDRKVVFKVNGTISRWPTGLFRYSIQYTAGYSGNAPAAFKIACLEMIKKAYDSPGVISENFQASSLNFESLASQCEIKELLQPFKMHSFVS